jgi:hypothetical protein
MKPLLLLPARRSATAPGSLLLIVLLLGISFFAVPPAAAQSGDWEELATTHFSILFTPADRDEAQNYAGFVDGIYEELTTIFSHRPRTPITLRLYPTLESYHEVNPLARNVPGVVAHADFRKREVVVVIEQTRLQIEPGEISNNIRHELVHIIAAELSDNRLNTGFQEGLAQYVEQSSPNILYQKARLVEQAVQQNQLLAWSDFTERDVIYGNPQLSYPQTLSVVAFLVERYGFGSFRDFLTTSAVSSGYRSALERSYGLAPAELEAEWREWLPGYIAGGYQNNALSTYDIAVPRRMLEQGRYADAQAELEQALELLRRNAEMQSPDVIAEAELLLTRSRDGQRAEQMLTAARTAIEQLEYERAGQLIAQSRQIYADLGDARQHEVLAAYSEHVSRGLGANSELVQAYELAQNMRFPQARAAADRAAAEFARLGDQMRFENALALRESMDLRQRMAGIVLITVGLFGVVLSLVARWDNREPDLW